MENKSKVWGQKVTLKEAIEKGRDLALRIKDETGCPGLVVAVSCDGKQVWAEGMGYADVENRVPCSPESVMRVASISKSITMTSVARLCESGKLDLDERIQQYVPDFPEKIVDGEKVTITTRQLVSHLAGIRHYDKTYMNKTTSDENKEKENKKEKKEKEKEKKKEKKEKEKENKKEKKEKGKEKKKEEKQKKKKKEMEFEEYYIKENYKTISDGIKLFRDDPLVHKPGSSFLYTSHGWTLVSAVVEGASKRSFKDVMQSLFKDLGMEHTYLDYNDVLIYNRSRNYIKNKNGRLLNAPYVDNSYKWAGGGFLSTVEDLVRFGNSMLYSFQNTTHSPVQSGSRSGDVEETSTEAVKSGTDTTLLGEVKESDDKGPTLPGYLKQETMKSLWTPVDKTECSWDKGGKYGMGWAVIPEKHEHGECCHQRYYVSHTGGAVGASSVLLVLPKKDTETETNCKPPKGVVVAIIVNMISIGLNMTALKIAKVFEDVDV